MFPHWYITAMAATGQSSGLVVLWDPHWKGTAFSCSARILIEAYFHGKLDGIHILNLYGPYRNMMVF